MKTQTAFIGLISSAVVLNTGVARAEGWQLPDNPGLPDSFMGSMQNIADWLLGFIVLLAVLAIIYGGMVYVAASGDEDRIRSAKKTIKYAIMGLVMAGLAYAIVTVIVEDMLKAGGGNTNGNTGANTNDQAM